MMSEKMHIINKTKLFRWHHKNQVYLFSSLPLLRVSVNYSSVKRLRLCAGKLSLVPHETPPSNMIQREFWKPNSSSRLTLYYHIV